MNLVLIVFVLLGYMGCVTPADRQEKYLNSLLGKKKRTLVKSFGVPDKIMELEDEDIYVYIHNKGGYAYGNAVQLVQCTTQFTLEDDIVVEWEWDGYCP